MKIINNLRKLDDIFIVVLFLIILFSSINIKIKYTTDIYTEYDDVGVISLHKGSIGDKEINFFDKSFIIKESLIKNLNNNILFPIYIAQGWTYAPGQYLIIPFLNLDKKKFKDKIFYTRFISLVISIVCSLVILYICLKYLEINKWLSLLIFCLFSFSLNLNIYSNHMSPYMTYVFCTVLGFALCFKGYGNKNPFLIYSFNTILIYFSYVNLLFYLCFIFIEWRKNNLFDLTKYIINYQKILLFLNFIIIIPLILLVLIKLNIYNASDRGITLDANLNILDSFKFVLSQINLSLNSVQAGFLPTSFSNFNPYFLILTTLLAFYVLKKFNKTERILFEVIILYLLIWIILFILGKLPLDQTRHSLIYFPMYIFLIGIIFNKINKINLISFLLIALLLVPSINLNHKILSQKKVFLIMNLSQNLILKIFTHFLIRYHLFYILVIILM